MHLVEVYDLSGIGGTLVAGALLYFTVLRPKLTLQRRLVERILGNDGKDGLPIEKSVFQSLADLTAHLTTQDVTLAHIAREIPPNGVPFRSDVDSLKASVIVMETNLSNLRREFHSFVREQKK